MPNTNYVERPGYGSLGQRIKLKANFFNIKTIPGIVYHYKVNIVPEVPRGIMALLIEDLKVQSDSISKALLVYNGGDSLFTASRLEIEDELKVKVSKSEKVRITEGNPFNIHVKLVNAIKSNSLNSFIEQNTKLSNEVLTYLMCMEIILKQKALEKYPVVKSTYFISENSQEISKGLQVCQGFYQSCKLTCAKVLLNVDSASTVFYPSGGLVDFVFKVLGLRSVSDLKLGINHNRIDIIKAYIIGVDIQVSHRKNKRFKIRKVSTKSAEEIKFSTDGKETNVVDYFKEKYNIKLEYPCLPCVIVNSNQNFPMELCRIVPNQKYMKKLDDRQVADIIKFSCRKPYIRFDQIEKNHSNLNNKDNQYLNEFGINIDNKFIMADARVIPAPSLVYFNQKNYREEFGIQNGVWDMRFKKFIRGVEIKKWGVLCIGSPRDTNLQKVQDFIRELVKICGQFGIRFRAREPPIYYSSPHQIKVNLKKLHQHVKGNSGADPDLLVCILLQKATDPYADIKKVCDKDLKVITQCIVAKNIFSPKPQYLSNIGLKLNAKIGGENTYVRSGNSNFVNRTPTMICGADISNPGQNGKGSSIASLVGSMNKELTSWGSTISRQPPKEDMIVNIESMMIELLKSFKKINNLVPVQLILYRDGVSDGQFKEVKDKEIKAVHEACSHVGIKNIKITFVIVQKRHHVRFLSPDRQFQDRSGNCVPGTVIDRSVTHPVEFDFYLFSHSGIQGTSKPTHYHVIEDENKFTPDELQVLTYNLCYLYARCTRSVSVVTPVYYAHLVGNRARLHSYSSDITDEGCQDQDQDQDQDHNKDFKQACTKLYYI